MDYLGEGIALAVDSIFFGVFLKMYLKRKNGVDAIKEAPILELNDKLESYVQSQPEHRIPYCAIRGTVAALGLPIQSSNAKNITGVVQRLTLKQHVVARNSTGFWSERERTIQVVYNDIPFVIRSGKAKVEVLDALSADILDLDTISEHFEPTTSSLGDHLWGFFSGVRQQGMQTTEEMLREGALITGIGELTYDSDFKDLKMQPSMNGPYYLTSLPLSSLVRKLQEQKHMLKNLTILFGGIGIFLACLIARRWWTIRLREQEETKRRQEFEATRKARRRDVRDRNLPEDQLCVVCRENPREMILLPCGHVCLCEDCSEGIKDLCPVCRRHIDTQAAAYLS